MYQLVIAAVLALGLSFAGWKVWDGFTGQYIAKGAAQQAAADEPVLEEAKAKVRVSEARATAAEADLVQAREMAAIQSAAIDVAAKLATEAADSARKQAILYAQEKAKGRERDAALKAAAAAMPKTGMSCEQVLNATDAILRESGRLRTAK